MSVRQFLWSGPLVAAALLVFSAQAHAALVGWWNLDDGSGTTAADGSPNPAGGSANNGTLVNISESNWNSGLSGLTDGITMPHGLLFDGFANQSAGDAPLGDFVSMDPHTGDFAALTQGSISAWFRRTQGASPDDNYFIGFAREEDQSMFRIGIETLPAGQGGGTVLRASQGDGQTTPPTVSNMDAAFTDDGNWHHVVYTSDGVNAALYLDGVEVATGSQGFISVPVTQMALGYVERENRPLWYWNGTLGDVRIYDHVLSQGEISYASNVANYGTGVVPEPSSILLLGMASIGLLCAARRRR